MASLAEDDNSAMQAIMLQYGAILNWFFKSVWFSNFIVRYALFLFLTELCSGFDRVAILEDRRRILF